MLVIISDLHLTDGTSGETITENAFKIFIERVEEMALRASYRQDDTYRPIKRIDILLLGDILDVIRSADWVEKAPKVRPWDDSSSKDFIERVTCITDAILRCNKPSLDHLKNLSENGLKLPPDDPDKQPAKDGDKCPVEVNIHYMVGNHDWFYHLSGDAYDRLRKRVVDAMGLANDPKHPSRINQKNQKNWTKYCASTRYSHATAIFTTRSIFTEIAISPPWEIVSSSSY